MRALRPGVTFPPSMSSLFTELAFPYRAAAAGQDNHNKSWRKLNQRGHERGQAEFSPPANRTPHPTTTITIIPGAPSIHKRSLNHTLAPRLWTCMHCHAALWVRGTVLLILCPAQRGSCIGLWHNLRLRPLLSERRMPAQLRAWCRLNHSPQGLHTETTTVLSVSHAWLFTSAVKKTSRYWTRCGVRFESAKIMECYWEKRVHRHKSSSGIFIILKLGLKFSTNEHGHTNSHHWLRPDL